MFKYYFERIHNVEIWPIISLAIFFIFFLGLLLYVWKMSREYIHQMEEMPLADDTPSQPDFQNEKNQNPWKG